MAKATRGLFEILYVGFLCLCSPLKSACVLAAGGGALYPDREAT